MPCLISCLVLIVIITTEKKTEQDELMNNFEDKIQYTLQVWDRVLTKITGSFLLELFLRCLINMAKIYYT